jgi:hypothetical protein
MRSPRTDRPSMATIWSPGFTPARAAGEPSIGAITVTKSFLKSTSTPTPPNLPSVSPWKSAYSEGVM